MPSNKDRLYIVLYLRGNAREDTYNWAFIVGPKIEPERGGWGIRFHVVDSNMVLSQQPPDWVYNEGTITLEPTPTLLVRVVVGKVKNIDRLQSILRQVPVRSEVPGWDCESWVKEALRMLNSDREAMGTSIASWDLVRSTVIEYANSKRAARRLTTVGQYDGSKVATWDMMEGKELIP
ncbi:hypothetical protein F5Y10DRAFT_267721 [Nemania abortiva]|nr:hypothetical protein F5Y10DRAFT_267721 [Nemania abortiva]